MAFIPWIFSVEDPKKKLQIPPHNYPHPVATSWALAPCMLRAAPRRSVAAAVAIWDDRSRAVWGEVLAAVTRHTWAGER